MKETLMLFIGFMLIFAAMLWIANLLNKNSCARLWANSGYEHRYVGYGACQIRTKEGTWIPTENFKVSP